MSAIKAHIAENRPYREILVRAQEEERSTIGKASVFLENACVLLNRPLVETWTAKMILKTS